MTSIVEMVLNRTQLKRQMDFETEKEADQLKEQILRLYDCPVCYECIYPRIGQCMRGHAFCGKCFLKVDQCPLCRAPKSIVEAYTLEAIYCEVAGKNTYECKDMFAEDQLSHCELDPFGTCTWRGPPFKLLQHLNAEHEGSIFYVDEKVFYPSSSLSFFLLYVYNTLFRVMCSFNGNDELILSVIVLDEQAWKDQQFAYKIFIHMKLDRKLVYEGLCACEKEEDNIICVENLDLRGKHRDEKSIYCNVKIIDKYMSHIPRHDFIHLEIN